MDSTIFKTIAEVAVYIGSAAGTGCAVTFWKLSRKKEYRVPVHPMFVNGEKEDIKNKILLLDTNSQDHGRRIAKLEKMSEAGEREHNSLYDQIAELTSRFNNYRDLRRRT